MLSSGILLKTLFKETIRCCRKKEEEESISALLNFTLCWQIQCLGWSEGEPSLDASMLCWVQYKSDLVGPRFISEMVGIVPSKFSAKTKYFLPKSEVTDCREDYN